MKIVYLAAGAAGMYCGSCLHDNTLAAALLELGEDVLLVPTYTPIRTDEDDKSINRVFFGGINVYLQQKSAVFRHTPRWFDGLLDKPAVLNCATKRAVSTRPENLGDLTVSMLQGESGRQKKELAKLVDWLVQEKPDIVHLSNSMLIGMAREIRRRVKVPVVCSLSGEDVFLERLTQPSYDQARALLRERAKDIAAFVALNRYYANYMTEYMELEPSTVHVIPHGLKLTGHGERQRTNGNGGVTIGYFARVCHDKGLHLLAEAFEKLSHDKTLPPLQLKVAGYLGPADKPYLADVERRLKAAGLGDRYRYEGEPDRAGKIAFLQSLDVMAIPTVYRESKGLSVLEAWANAVPLVLPRHGTFPELVEDTGGGLLCEPNDPASLAECLARLIRNPDLSIQCSVQAQAAIRERYNDRVMAERTRELYRKVLA